MARPTKYNHTYEEQVYKLCLLGADDVRIADFFNVDVATIHRWKKSQKGFCDSIKRGKDEADGVIAASLFHRAKGYQHPEVDIKVINGKIKKTPLTKHYPPDTVAAIFWLKNRQPAMWRDKQEIDHKNSGVIHTTVDLTPDQIKNYNKALEEDF